ncbi:MAG: hypothetical protein IKO56_08410 [Alphaproteobacteria bacterium]|nr:hypothetical protein [Alphaproteobacteria bacterium]
MDRLRETQLTQRATRRPCEYNYTNADIHSVNVQPGEGYQFEYPVNWAGDPSTNKVIGLRRISYKPTSVNIALEIKVTYTYDLEGTETEDTATIPVVGIYTAENSFEECWTDMAKQITDQIKTQSLQTKFHFIQSYNKDTGKFKMSFEKSDERFEFEIDFKYGNDYLYDGTDTAYGDVNQIFYKSEFLRLFNQPVTKENVDSLYNDSFYELEYENVWNRDSFYCHASFSDSPRKIIGINKDFWPTPSVFYEYSDNSNDFNIYFTTDTVHRILPRHGVLLIQISYIYNYQTSYLSY